MRLDKAPNVLDRNNCEEKPWEKSCGVLGEGKGEKKSYSFCSLLLSLMPVKSFPLLNIKFEQ